MAAPSAPPFVFTTGTDAPPSPDVGAPRPALPVDVVADQVSDAVREHRVTLIFGATGSGKSTRVPGLVQKTLGGAVLCTMPRRLAATAAAHRCASEHVPPVDVGGAEVGWHIGADRRCSDATRLVFCTAGVLVELIRGGGETALDRFKAIIVDEVHERSVENDLVLALLRTLMRKRPRLACVLMSATFDPARYEAYFSDDAFGRVARVAIPEELPDQRFLTFHRSSAEYLEHVLRFPGFEEHAAVVEQSAVAGDAPGNMHLPPTLHSLIHDLVLHLHRNVCKSGREVILVFLPTYRALEHQYELLTASLARLSVHALHSAIDMETCAKAIAEGDGSAGRKVILATNVAESSVTIPGVTAVIDSCRTLALVWNPALQRDVPVVRFISKSQADQRKGRTGRTCAGTCYRLVTRTQYEKFATHEPPAVRQSSLREPALVLACSAAPATADPHALLASCLDPPERAVVADALAYLQKIDAVQLRANGKPAPTLLGRLLVSMPLALPAARLAVLGGHQQALRDVAALAAILDKSPLPILQPFGDASGCAANLQLYLRHARPSDRVSSLLANLAAYEFWQRVRRDERRWKALETLAATPQAQPEPPQPPLDAVAEERWCAAHRLSLTALLQVEQTVSQVMDTCAKFRPAFMADTPAPAWAADTVPVDHVCSEGELCALSVPQLSELFADGLAGKLERILAAIVDQEEEGPSTSAAITAAVAEAAGFAAPQTAAPVCVFFLRKGGCTKADCRFVHAAAARPPDCRFFGTPAGCSFGSRCAYYHNPAKAAPLPPWLPLSAPGGVRAADLLMPERPPPKQLEQLLLRAAGEAADTVLLLGEGDFSFAEVLVRRKFAAKRVVATSLQSRAQVEACFPDAAARLARLEAIPGVTLMHGVDATRLDRAQDVPWQSLCAIVWNLPYAGGSAAETADADADAEDPSAHRRLLRAFLRSAAIHTLVCCPDARILLTLCNDQAARWGLDGAARDALMHCDSSWAFERAAWPGYAPVRNDSANDFPAAELVTYCLRAVGRGDPDIEADILEECFARAEAGSADGDGDATAADATDDAAPQQNGAA